MPMAGASPNPGSVMETQTALILVMKKIVSWCARHFRNNLKLFVGKMSLEINPL